MKTIDRRFRKFLPVVIDVETAGFNPATDALLEMACVFLDIEDDKLVTTETEHFHIMPFKGANLEPDALEFNNIDPFHPFRYAISERETIEKLEKSINKHLKKTNCTKAVLVGHNAWFDLSFILSACKRENTSLSLHSFTTFDTATLGAVFYGQTVLAKALAKAGIPYNPDEAHSALYDAEVTASLFCKIINNMP